MTAEAMASAVVKPVRAMTGEDEFRGPAQGTARASGNPFRRVPWLTSHAGSVTI
jgi:hypothetical protein